MNGLTGRLGEFLESVEFGMLPPETLPMVRDAFTDTVAVMMAGINEPIVDIIRRNIVDPRSSEEARVCLSNRRIWAPGAALIGGTASHALDFDDQSLTGHPSAVLVPAILAEGEALGSTGSELVTAYVAGYEVWAEVIRRNTGYHSKGWHPTSVFGVLGAAAAVAVLRRLPAERAATALAIAASNANGLGANFGTMTKPFHAGMAASNGITAARLAAAGATAAIDALESPTGFLTAFSPGSEPDRHSAPRIGEEWSLPWQGLCIKKYPTCYFMHRSFEAAVQLLKKRDIGPDDISEIEVTMGRGQTAVLTNERPTNALEAKFSEQFAMSVAVILGRMGVEEVSDAVVQRPDIQALFPKVTVIAVDEYDPRDPAHSPTERVVIRLENGESLDSGPIASIRGHANDPLSAEELWAKFEKCTRLTHKPSDARKLFGILQEIDSIDGTEDIPTANGLFGEEQVTRDRRFDRVESVLPAK